MEYFNHILRFWWQVEWSSWYFVGLLPLIWWLVWKEFKLRNARPSIQFSSLEGITPIKTFKIRMFNFLPILLGLSLTILTLALCRPMKALSDNTVKTEGIDILFAIDISNSMLAKDFEPDRLTVAKQVAEQFANNRINDRLGLVLFSGDAFAQCPLTSDHEVLKAMLRQIQAGALADGTAIGMGLGTAVNRLQESKAKSKVIILMTDGENNAGYIQPEVAADLAAQTNCKVYTIGVGTEGTALTPVARQYDGTIVYGYSKVNIDEKLLKDIASKTGGKYYRARNGQELHLIYNEINQLEKTTIDAKVYQQKQDIYRPLALLGLLLLLAFVVLKWLYIKPLEL